MANTYTLIEAQTLVSSAASVTFSSIPATYTDLAIRISARITTTDVDDLRMQFNSLTTYSYTQLIARSGTTVVSSRVTGGTRIRVSEVNGAVSTANTFTSTEVYIPNYNSSTAHPVSSFGAVEQNDATAVWKLNTTAGLYSATSVPITSITFSANAFSYLTGSSFYLYGIKNS